MDGEFLNREFEFYSCRACELLFVEPFSGFEIYNDAYYRGAGPDPYVALREGVAQPADIDRALELGYRHPMGPLKLTDLVGLDVRLDIARYLHEKLGAEHFRPPAILERLVAEGHLGKKTGRGFYDWSES